MSLQVIENSSQFPVGWCQPPLGSPNTVYLNWVSPEIGGNDSFGKEVKKEYGKQKKNIVYLSTKNANTR